jgi:ribosomal protein S18 acetylase RimI-like enzyme
MTMMAWEEQGLILSEPRLESESSDAQWVEFEALWSLAYGQDKGPHGWLREKLEREGCFRSDNAVLRDAHGELVAFFLTGHSDEESRHGLGLAVHPRYRGLSVGSDLVTHVLERMRAREGFRLAICEIEAERVEFYSKLGFTLQSRHVHLRHLGAGEHTLRPGADSTIPLNARVAWKACAWSGTLARQRAVVRRDEGSMGVSREGDAWLAQWWSRGHLSELAHALRVGLDAGEPTYLYGVDVTNPACDALFAQGWRVAQRFERWVWPAEPNSEL